MAEKLGCFVLHTTSDKYTVLRNLEARVIAGTMNLVELNSSNYFIRHRSQY
jgi:hypothetical protein